MPLNYSSSNHQIESLCAFLPMSAPERQISMMRRLALMQTASSASTRRMAWAHQRDLQPPLLPRLPLLQQQPAQHLSLLPQGQPVLTRVGVLLGQQVRAANGAGQRAAHTWSRRSSSRARDGEGDWLL